MANAVVVDTFGPGIVDWTPVGTPVGALTIECIGSGAGGDSGGSGGGGGYARTVATFGDDLETTWRVNVGVGGSPGGGGSPTSVRRGTAGTVLANGFGGGAGDGGSGGSGTGDVVFDGGDGRLGGETESSGACGASSTSNGADASTSDRTGAADWGAFANFPGSSTSLPRERIGNSGGSNINANGEVSGGHGLARITYTVNVADGFPRCMERVFGRTTTTTTSHTVPLPSSIEAGDYLDIIVGSDGLGAQASSNPTATGWTQLFQNKVNGTQSLTYLYKTATGSEGSTVTVTNSGSPNHVISYIARRFKDVSGTPVHQVATGTSSAPQAPAVSGTSGPKLVSALAAVNADTVSQGFISEPTDYDSLCLVMARNQTQYGELVSAERFVTSLGDTPGAWTFGSNTWCAANVLLQGIGSGANDDDAALMMENF